jgi:hypothetical protein
MPRGPDQQYLCKYNNYVLPGYVQQESFDSQMNIADHYATYADGSLSEYTGLQNKQLSVTLKVWEDTFLIAREQVELAATYLRSKKAGFAPLYVAFSDRHYDALCSSIALNNTAGGSTRLMSYDATFECRPWLIRDTTHTITGTGTISTDQVSRTLSDGGWTPATITVTGTNVTISGYTDDGQFTGFASIAGAVSNLIINSEDYTAEISSVNSNDLMNNVDYQIFVGPGKTNFVITGASACTITYSDRWYI